MDVLLLAVVMAALFAALGWFIRPVWEPDRRKAAVGMAILGFVLTLLFSHVR